MRAQVRPGLRRSAPTATGWIYVGLGDGGFASRCLRTRQARSGAARSWCARWLEWLVAPGADAVVAAVLVPALGHQPGAVADLDLEAGRRCDVEAEHLIVGMLAEAAGDGAARFPRAVEGVADVVAVGDLDHEVVQLLGQVERCPHQCQRVVPRVAVVEADLEL